MRRREEGAVLLVVLVALAILAALAGVALRLGMAGVQGLEAERAVFQREVLAQSALVMIGQRLGAGLAEDGQPEVLEVPGGRVEVRVQAAEGLLNPGYARLPLLQGLFIAEGATPEQALRLARSIGVARKGRALRRPSDLAPLFAADLELWPRVAPFLTFLGRRSVIDAATAPEVLRQVAAAAVQGGVDFTAPDRQRGFYEIDLRVLAAGETVQTARGAMVHYAVLRDRAGGIHLFARDWPKEAPE
jgi:hypothetical protein